MPGPTSPSSARALSVLRLGVAVLIGVHGFFRVFKGTVPDFGAYLSSVGFPLGTALAWAITLAEITGVLCLATGRFVRWVIPVHLFILVMGIYLVHGREGWFVVGGGRNGMEYSLLLIVALVTLWLAEPDQGRVIKA